MYLNKIHTKSDNFNKYLKELKKKCHSIFDNDFDCRNEFVICVV